MNVEMLRHIFYLFSSNHAKMFQVGPVVHVLYMRSNADNAFTNQRDSSPKNEYFVIIYSPPYRFKPVRLLFISETQMKIFE